MHYIYRELIIHRIRAKHSIEIIEEYLENHKKITGKKIDMIEYNLLIKQIKVLKEYIELLDKNIEFYESH